MDEKLKAALLESIAYSLKRSLPAVPKRGPWRGLEQTQIDIAAKAVLEHMQLCGFIVTRTTFTRQPPTYCA